jgi:hypothetical protein
MFMRDRVISSQWILNIVLSGFVFFTTLPVRADHWVSESVRIGEDGQLCEALHKRLNEMLKSNRSCMSDAIETYPEFSDPPRQSLNPREHFELIVKLERYMQEGARRFFIGPHKLPDETYRARAQRFIENGGRLEVWRTRLLSFYDDAATRPTPPSEQVIVRLTDTLGTAQLRDQCTGKASHGWVRFTFIVLPDLSGPDQQIDAGTAAVLNNKWPVLYQGRTLLINTYSVFGNFAAGPHVICSFKLVKDKTSQN